ncbi:MAG TPA: PRC-barrel domain-containing protein [Bacillota bacterium]|nr:PRC-barrel domain-containing protein [Bacillota bacterium]
MECEEKLIKGRKITGLPVIASDNGELLGYVRELLYAESGREVRGILLEEGTWLKGARLILWENLVSLNSQGILVPGRTAVLYSSDQDHLNALCNNRTGLCGTWLTSSAGEELGTVEDIVLEPLTGKVTGYELSQGITEDLLEGRKEIVLPENLTPVDGKLMIPGEQVQIIQPETG